MKLLPHTSLIFFSSKNEICICFSLMTWPCFILLSGGVLVSFFHSGPVVHDLWSPLRLLSFSMNILI